MKRQELRDTMMSQFYQSLAESGVEIDAIPQAQLQALVNAFADSVFAALERLEEEAMPAPAARELDAMDDPAAEEVLLWSGRPYLTIGVRYELTNQRIRVIRGLLGRDYEEIELVRVRDTAVSQHLGERLLNVGDITIISNDPSNPEFVLHNVKDPMDVREMIRRATLAEKQRRGLHYREEM